MNYQPIVIIGAPRSGTNMLRDVLCELKGVGTWPCDEINYIWRHGNIKEETEEFGRELARPEVKRYIRQQFDKYAHNNNLDVLIEKTCANSYRVPFVDEVVPEAKYIFIYRNGIDATASAVKRWKAKLDIPYIMKKARYVPVTDIFYYAVRYLGSHVYRLFSNEERLSFWGPKFKGYKEALKKYSLEEVCALQWKASVDLSEKGFSEIEPDKVVRVSYESFTANPNKELKRILEELDLKYSDQEIEYAIKDVSDKSVGKGKQSLSKESLKKVVALIKDSLKRYGYDA
jgi:hypothetical protein